jgi:hypothetical protein
MGLVILTSSEFRQFALKSHKIRGEQVVIDEIITSWIPLIGLTE